MSDNQTLEEAQKEIKNLKARLVEEEKKRNAIFQAIDRSLESIESMRKTANSIAKDYAVKVAEILHCKSDDKKEERDEAHLNFIHWDYRAKASCEAEAELKRQRPFDI